MSEGSNQIMKFIGVNFNKKLALAAGCGIVVFIISFYVSYSSLIANTREEISRVEAEISRSFADYGKEVGKGIVFLGPLWRDVDKICQPLSWKNQKIAKAKVMVRYNTKPNQNDMDIWRNREKLSNQAWHVEGKFMRLLKSMGISALVGVLSSILLLGLVFAVSWTWYFLLERIRELFKAIRG